VVDIVGPCPKCDGIGLDLMSMGPPPTPAYVKGGCVRCVRSGTVRLARATVRCLPVYGRGDRIPIAWMPHVAPGNGDWCIFDGPNVTNGENLTTGRYDWKLIPITLDPPTPGQFVIVVEPVP
jgi:hypothetical protein